MIKNQKTIRKIAPYRSDFKTLPIYNTPNKYIKETPDGVQLVGGDFRSPNYVRRLSGWLINALGQAFFKKVIIRNTEPTYAALEMDSATFAFKFSGSEKGHTAAGDAGFDSNEKGTFTLVGFIKVDVGGSTYYMPYGTIA
jgi:hypothetical protein